MATDRLGDEIDADGRMIHSVPLPLIQRLILGGAGAFVLIVATLELHRGVWPVNIASPFFALLLVGSWSVGVPMLLVGVLGPAMHWLIEPGRIEVTLVNPFGRKRFLIGASQLVAIDIREVDWDSQPATFAVQLRTTDGKTYESRSFGSRAVAEGFRDRIRQRLAA